MYEIDRDLDIPLYIQIRTRVEKLIESGELQPGDRLPSVSSLAKAIGVTQATVRRALQDLGEAGHTTCHVGRGTFIRDVNAVKVDDEGPSEFALNQRPEAKGRSRQMLDRPREHAARRLRTGVSKALYDIMPLAHKPGMIALTKGTPDASDLPARFLDETCEDVLKNGSVHYIAATDPLGVYDLRKEIARRASEDGMVVTPDMVMITNGVSQAITLIAQSAMEEQPEIICETPCFQGISNSFAAMGHWVETVQRDEQGPIIEQLERFSDYSPRMFYLCPYVHNPMGTDISPERSRRLVEWAKRTGSIVIADEIFRDLRFERKAQPSLLKDLGGEQAIVVSSMSKSVMTGLRIGWIITSPKRIQELAQLKRLMDHSAPAITQALALNIYRSGRFDSHVESMRLVYQKRMSTLINSLEKLMPKEIRWSRPNGGFSILLELPRGYSSVALLLTAIDKGVSFLPGPLFDIDQRYVHGMRLSTAWADEHQIKEGIELLANAIEEFLEAPPSDTGLSGLGGFQ
ncbi:PLP-dependent aminotransferase family protein [Desulfosediminicola flagellatus]|uniref:aminotransferase-like domain-containing protein n=1 Tax=Desulfosediminicola flagellatus TaxID=2569541 RepID=UPI00142EE342|nr:PLP-dependent aminotransferase family protein [Desulfosediminicola flagellatus]